MDPFLRLVAALDEKQVRFTLIGVWGANFWARSGSTLFTTEDYDLLVPPDPDNEVQAWATCEILGLSLRCGDEPLDKPRDRFLAERIVSSRALVRATDGHGLDVDLTLVMAGFAFEEVWSERRLFKVDGVLVPVARLSHIIASKAAAGRLKDRLFLATHEEALRELLGRKGRSG